MRKNHSNNSSGFGEKTDLLTSGVQHTIWGFAKNPGLQWVSNLFFGFS